MGRLYWYSRRDVLDLVSLAANPASSWLVLVSPATCRESQDTSLHYTAARITPGWLLHLLVVGHLVQDTPQSRPA